MSAPLLAIEDLHVSADGSEILRGLDLVVPAGEVHALMGPNGSGKSTLANVLLGSPEYEVTQGTIRYQGDDIAGWSTDVRGKAGIFLAFQYPMAIAGVSVLNFLRQALSARKGIDLSILELRLAIMEWMERLDMDPSFADRYLNEGFSGGEKKRNEILQMAILEPELAILDETDSGLDIDALKVVARGVQEVRAERPELGVLAITHYQRLLDHLQPDRIHVLSEGRIVASGGMELAARLEAEGYEGIAGMSLDVTAVRKDFPLLAREVYGKPICYLDSAASSQKPQAVLDAMDHYYETTHANVHRGVYAIAEEATRQMEEARAKVARFIGAPSERGVIFTKNVTEALNLVAQSWGRANLGPGDAIVLTQMEHHANIVPWLMLAEQTGFEIRWLGVTDDGHLDLSDLDRLVDGAKLVSLTAMSNVLGTLTPVRRVADVAHAAGAVVVVDGAQYTPHLRTDVAELGADFYGFTGHKMCGPTGVGVLWGREDLLEAMPAFLGGGEMIRDVRLDGWTPNDIPWKFEAGTPPIAEIIGLGAAVDYLEALDMDAVREHEVSLTGYALRSLTERFGDDLTIHGPSEPGQRGGVVSFALKDIHAHDVSQVLDQDAVCVRAGHHCAKPLMRLLDVSATARASFYVYNDTDDVDRLSDAIAHTAEFFAR